MTQLTPARRVVITALVCASAVAAPARAANRLYWPDADTSKIWFTNLDGGGGGEVPIAPGLVNNPVGVTIDTANGRIYWANYASSQIVGANLDGRDGRVLETGNATVAGPQGVAVDPQLGRIYWANYDGQKISFANLDGSGGGNVFTGNATVNGASAVAVDAQAGRVYWTNFDGNKISFANLDGTGGEDLKTGIATVDRPVGIAIDRPRGKIYWANFGDRISWASLNGAGGGDLNPGAARVVHPVGVAVDAAAGSIYWANQGFVTQGPPGIAFARLDDSGGDNVPTGGVTPSAPSGAVLLDVPASSAPPVLSGQAVVGSSLSCSPGQWAPDIAASQLYRAPQSFAYRWSRGGVDVSGASASTYVAAVPGAYRCTVTASNAAGGASATSASLSINTAPVIPLRGGRPTISRLRERNATFEVTPAHRGKRHRSHGLRLKRGTVFSFQLDRAASVRVAIRSLRQHRGHVAGTLTLAGHRGLNTLAFSGRIGGRALAPGRYQALFSARDAAGASAPSSLDFRIVR
jgi:hypothetical protein